MKKNCFLLLILLGFIPFSCEKDETSCGKSKPSKNNVTKFKIEEFGISTITLDKSLDTNIYTSIDSIYKKVYILKKTYLTQTKPFHFSFSNSLYACSPPILFSTNIFSEIEIKSKSNFIDGNDSVILGENITSKFKIKGTYSNFIEIKDFIKEKNSLNEDSKQYFKAKIKPHENLDLIFDLIITLSDGTKQIFSNQLLKISKSN